MRTRGGRWIFPKGGVEAGLTQAQSAALEAFEEAGVHGRIEEMPFARYRVAKSAGKKPVGREVKGKTSDAKATPRKGETVTAHLCEVSYLEPPQEAYRTPTWFSAEKAKRRLRGAREPEFGEALAGVVDRALSRIRRLEASASRDFQNDALRKVRFEAGQSAPLAGFVSANSREISLRARTNSGAEARRPLIEAREARETAAVEGEARAAPVRRKKNYIQ